MLANFIRLRHLPLIMATVLTLLSVCIAAPITHAATTQTAFQKCGATDVKCVVVFGDQRVTERQEALTTLTNKVETHQTKKHIGEDQAEALLNDAKSNQDALTNLKTKLDAETNADAARQDIKNLYDQLRIFAVVLPRDYHQLHLDIEITLLDKLKDLQSRIEQNINKASSDKQAQAQDPFNDYKAALAAAESQIGTIQGTFAVLTPANFNANHTTFEATIKNLTNVEQAISVHLHKAVTDLRQITQILKVK